MYRLNNSVGATTELLQGDDSFPSRYLTERQIIIYSLHNSVQTTAAFTNKSASYNPHNSL